MCIFAFIEKGTWFRAQICHRALLGSCFFLRLSVVFLSDFITTTYVMDTFIGFLGVWENGKKLTKMVTIVTWYLDLLPLVPKTISKKQLNYFEFWVDRAGKMHHQNSPVTSTSGALTVQERFFIKDFFSKYYQIPRRQRIWSYLLKKSLMENFIFCAVTAWKVSK